MFTDPTRRGIAMVTLAVALFAIQDGFSRHLAGEYNTLMIVAIRYWVFAAFVILLALRRPGGIRSVATARPGIQLARAVLLVAEIITIIYGYTRIGLIESHAVFACCPLLVAALAGPVLDERVGWRRWTAIAIGFVGVLVILKPGGGVFSVWSLLPLAAALMYAYYSLLTRRAAATDDSLVSLFWAAVIGAVLITPIGIAWWQPMSPGDWAAMGIYAALASTATWLVIRAYELAEASALQPFIYLQLVFVAIIGFTVFNEVLRPNVAVGAVIVVAAGLFTLIRTRKVGGTTGTAQST